MYVPTLKCMKYEDNYQIPIGLSVLIVFLQVIKIDLVRRECKCEE